VLDSVKTPLVDSGPMSNARIQNKVVNLWLTDEERERWKAIAARFGLSLSDLIRLAVANADKFGIQGTTNQKGKKK
jgi:hypothetical protein